MILMAGDRIPELLAVRTKEDVVQFTKIGFQDSFQVGETMVTNLWIERGSEYIEKNNEPCYAFVRNFSKSTTVLRATDQAFDDRR